MGTPASEPYPAAVDPSAAKLAERLADRVEVLAQRVDTLSETARAASSGLVARERELATIRRELADAHARVDAAVTDLGRRVDRPPVEALERSVAELSDRFSSVERGNGALTDRIESLAGTADTARASLTAHERALAELSTEVEAGTAKTDSVVLVVREAIESLLAQVAGNEARVPDHTSTEPAGERLEALAEKVDGLVASLEASSRATAERERALATAEIRLEARLDELSSRLVALESRPRLVADSRRVPASGDELGAEDDNPDAAAGPGDGAHSFEDSSLDSNVVGSDTRGPVVSFGGGS